MDRMRSQTAYGQIELVRVVRGYMIQLSQLWLHSSWLRIGTSADDHSGRDVL